MTSDRPTMPIVNNCDRTAECPSPLEHDARCPKFDAEFWSKVQVRRPGELPPEFPAFAPSDPAPAADGGEVEALTEALLFGVSGGGVDAGKTFRESIARRLLASDWLADLRRTEWAEGAREALLAAAEAVERAESFGCRESLTCHTADAALLRARAEPTTDRPGDGVEVREVGGRG